MNDQEFELLDRIEEDHWWFVGKRLLLRALLDAGPPPRRLLDLGCGSGGVLRDWMERCACVGVDRSELGLRICARRGFSRVARCDLNRLPFRPETFDTVLLLDVLEHLEDDRGFLRRAAGACAPGGRLVIAVPAFPLLWSQHDVTFQHHRRYRARELEAVVRDAGLVPERTTYTNFWVFPVAALWRVLSHRLGLGRVAPEHDFWPVPAPVNRLLVALYRLEARMLARWRLPFGVSVVCVASRPAAPGVEAAPS